MKITGIWITKNSGKFIGYSVASLLDVLDQVIVMDGESTDNTLNMLFSFKSPKIQVTVLNQDRYNMNHQAKIGFQHAVGDVVMLLGDDYLWDRANSSQLRRYCLRALEDGKKGIMCSVYNIAFVPKRYFTKVTKGYIHCQHNEKRDPLMCVGSFFVDQLVICHKSEIKRGPWPKGVPKVRQKGRQYIKSPLSFSHWKYMKDTKEYFMRKYVLYKKDTGKRITEEQAEQAWKDLHVAPTHPYPGKIPEVLYEYRDKFVPLGGFDIKL